MRRSKRGSFGYTAKHHQSSGHTWAVFALQRAIDAHNAVESGNCRQGLKQAAEAARILGRSFQDYHAAGSDAYRVDPDFVDADKRLDTVLSNIKSHCMKG